MKKKGRWRRERWNGMRTEERAALWWSMAKKGSSHTHIWKEDTISLCVSECVCACMCACSCAHACRNGRSATFQIIPHTGGSTLSLYTPGPAQLTHYRSPWCVLVCNCPDSVKQTTAPVCHWLFNKKFCLETLNLQLLRASGENHKFYQ